MDGKILARIGVVIFVALAITATAIEMNRKDDRIDVPAMQSRPVTTSDPFAAELRRCSEIGEAGPRDPVCLKVWAQNRRRFLGRPALPSPPASAAPNTMFPGSPVSIHPSHEGDASADLTESVRSEVR
ncbi:putative entry exclusion protein TrbK-alt [Labrys neptuniae]